MYAQITVKDGITVKLARIQPRILPGLRNAADEAMQIVEGKARGSLQSKLRTRTGRGLRSVKASRARITGNRVKAKLPARPRAKSSGWYYLMFHEKGAVIRPKRKKYLAVPLPDGTMRKVKQVILPRRQWFKPAIEKSIPKAKMAIMRHIERIFRG